jgi:cell division initiation protein
MDLTPETLRSATFRDKLRGYHPDDVDEFLESVARGLEVLLARLRDATEKARSVAPPVDASPKTDEAVRTLALAQRTADLAIHEAKAEAERLVRTAEQKARRLVSGAEDSAAQIAEQAQAELRSDLEKLQTVRDQLFGEVKALGSWLDGERGRIKRALIEVADRIEQVRDTGDAPPVKPVSTPTPPREKLAADRAAGTNTPPPPRPAAPAEPPIERPRATVTPPIAAPTANPKHTPPTGQPAVRAARPAPAPERPQPVPTPAAGFGATGDAGVLNRAQQAVTAAAPDDDDDPFFAELRAAMLDQSPLGPRDDDEFAG